MRAPCLGCGGSAARRAVTPERAIEPVASLGIATKKPAPMTHASTMPTLLKALSQGRRPEKSREMDKVASLPALPRAEYIWRETEASASPVDSTSSTPASFTGPIAKSVNTVIDHLWPRISTYATEVIVNEIQPQLLENLPAALQSLSFDPSLCHLGQRPLEVRRVHIVRDEQETSVGNINNLVVKATIDWDADCSVYLRYVGAGLGIRGLSIRGQLVFELVGLIDKPPFVEGIRAFFNNRPKIHMDFRGTGQALLNSGLIRRKILDIVSDGVSDAMVLPNRIGFALSPGADIFNIKCPPPQGILTLTIHSARDLLAKDISWFGRPSSDPYVVVECGAYRFRSETHCKTLAPTFEYTVALPVTEVGHQRIHFELFDEDTMKSDDFLGRLSLAVERIVAWGPDRQVTLELEDEQKHRGASGSVTMSARWESLTLDTAGEHFEKPGLVFVGVDTASNLVRAGVGTQYWVKVTCSGISPGFPKATNETEKVLEDAPVLPPEVEDGCIGAESMKRRLATMRKYNMSEEDMADVLNVTPEMLRSCMLMHSKTETATTLLVKSRAAAFTAEWEHGFEFPVDKVSASVLTFVLMRKLPGRSAEELGTYETAVSDLKGARNSTLWRNIEVPGTDVRLRLKLGTRHREPPVTCVQDPSLISL